MEEELRLSHLQYEQDGKVMLVWFIGGESLAGEADTENET